MSTPPDNPFTPRPGRIRSAGSGGRAKTYLTRMTKALSSAGGVRRTALPARPRVGPRGGQRRVIVKARIVRMSASSVAALAAHIGYIRRDAALEEKDRGKLFDAMSEDANASDLVKSITDDRHHFRFIVSPEDAEQMRDLKGFTRELMTRMEKDLGTRLDWRAVEHWNTDNPHIHIIVRGVGEDGQNLIISRDYIREGMRAQAREIVTQELGPRTDLEIRQSLERQIEAERWTEIDRDLSRTMQRNGLIDMAPEPSVRPDGDHVLRMGRLRKLERLGLASEIAPGQWTLAGDAQAALRELGERDDIIKRMHKAMSDRGIDRGAGSYVLDADPAQPVIGRLVDRGLHDELTGKAYAIVDGIDGRTHHVQLPDIEATGDCRPGAIVELRRFEDRKGRQRVALAVRSDMDLEAQVRAPGATWLDRRNLSGDGHDLGGGFGTEVRAAMEARAEHLADEGLARRQGQRIIFARNLLDTLRRRELDAAAKDLSAEIGQPHAPSKAGEYVAGTVRQRITLASGRFAMIDNGLSFQLVPWSPSLDRQIGKHISGVMRTGGGVDWSFGRGRGLGL